MSRSFFLKIFAGLFIIFFVNSALANSVKIKNLKNHFNPVWYNFRDVPATIDTLTLKAGDSAYALSIPLIASAQFGDDARYAKIAPLMLTAVEKIPADQHSFKAWMYGRMLLAADSIDDAKGAKLAQERLLELLNDSKTKQDEFSAWAWGYLAAVDAKSYKSAKDSMKIAANKLTEICKATPESSPKYQEARSNALWAWTMAVLAAANADDMEMYNTALLEMKSITHEKTVSAALSNGLLRTSASNDYPAWAMAITMLASARVKDKDLYSELQRPLTNSIEGAKSVGALAEEVLAQLNAEIALLSHAN